MAKSCVFSDGSVSPSGSSVISPAVSPCPVSSPGVAPPPGGDDAPPPDASPSALVPRRLRLHRTRSRCRASAPSKIRPVHKGRSHCGYRRRSVAGSPAQLRLLKVASPRIEKPQMEVDGHIDRDERHGGQRQRQHEFQECKAGTPPRWSAASALIGGLIGAAANATGLPGGSLRSSLQTNHSHSRSECHRLARWIVTLLATDKSSEVRCECHRLARWIVTFLATDKSGRSRSECHRLARWIVTLLATDKSSEVRCECHRLARWIVTLLATRQIRRSRSECHRLARWIVTFLATGRRKILPIPPRDPPNRSIWCCDDGAPLTPHACLSARNVSIHRASRWH